MQEITEAITAKHAQVKTLQSDIDALQRAVSILGGAVENAGAVLLSDEADGLLGKRTGPGRKRATAKATRQPKTRRKRRKLSAAARKTISEKVKASWAKRKRASSPWQKGLFVNRGSCVRIDLSPVSPTTNPAHLGPPGPRIASNARRARPGG